MLKRTFVIMFVLVCTAACTMWKKPGTGWSAATGGEQLEKLFWDDVKAKNAKSLDQHLAASFAGAGPSGPMDRATFLRELQAYQLSSVSLANCSTQMNGADLMVTCIVRREGSVPGVREASTLSVWQQLKKGWVLVAHSETPLPPAAM
jgi:Domain of unknown function (DUF4440)